MAGQDGGSSMAGPKLRSTKVKMADNECILCEFINEGNAVAVGYRSWLETKNTADVELDDIVATGETVKVKWPNIVIGPPSTTMAKKLAKCKWQVSAAKIIARGEWTEMCNRRINLEKYGIANPERTQRKIIQRREENENSPQNSDKNTAKPSTKRAEASHKALQQQRILRKYKAQKDSHAVISDESSVSSDNIRKSSRSEHFSEISRLKKENAELKAEISELRALTIISNDLIEMKKISISVLANLQSIKEITAAPFSNKISGEEVAQSAEREYDDPILKAADDFLLNENLLDQTQSPKRQNDTKRLSAVLNAAASTIESVTSQTDTPILDEESSLTAKAAGSLALQTESKSIHESMIQEAEVVSRADISSANSNPLPKSELMKLAAQNPTQLVGREIALGSQGVVCSASRVLQCNHAVPEKLVCDLLSVVFSKEELATSSLTGKVSNTHIKKGVLPKLPLDQVRVNAIRSYMNTWFPNNPKLEDILKKAIQRKCNNAAPRKPGQKAEAKLVDDQSRESIEQK